MSEPRHVSECVTEWLTEYAREESMTVHDDFALPPGRWVGSHGTMTFVADDPDWEPTEIRLGGFRSITDAEVAEMREQRQAGATYSELAEFYGIHPTHASKLVRGTAKPVEASE